MSAAAPASAPGARPLDHERLAAAAAQAFLAMHTSASHRQEEKEAPIAPARGSCVCRCLMRCFGQPTSLARQNQRFFDNEEDLEQPRPRLQPLPARPGGATGGGGGGFLGGRGAPVPAGVSR